MVWLILGIVLWYGGHFFKRAAPGLRAKLGDEAGKGVVALVLLASIVLMVIGFRGLYTDNLYTPLPGMGHLMNLTTLIALFIMVSSGAGGHVERFIRHPQLTGFALWSASHLLVNGDLASVILFGTLTIWALVEITVINRAAGGWQRPSKGLLKKDALAAGIAIVAYAIITGIHMWLGYNPFLGTYG